MHRLGDAARRLGEGKLDTRLRVSGTDELADLSRTFNRTAESLEKRVADMSAREEAVPPLRRRHVARAAHPADRDHRRHRGAGGGGGDGSLDPMIAPAVQLVVSETRRLNDLVENLMEVTRFDAGTARLVLDDVDVADQITACIDARAWLDAVDLDAERGIMARLDPRRLDVILANLIGNALKHGGSPVRVSVRAEGDDELVIEVRDHGPGIPEDVLPHVFDRFYKASASRPRSEGSGLGPVHRPGERAHPRRRHHRGQLAGRAARCSRCGCRGTRRALTDDATGERRRRTRRRGAGGEAASDARRTPARAVRA